MCSYSIFGFEYSLQPKNEDVKKIKVKSQTIMTGDWPNEWLSTLFGSLPCVSPLFILDAHLVIESFHKRPQQRGA